MLLPQTLTPLAAGGLNTITNLAIAIFIVSGVIVALALLFDPNSPLYVMGTKFIQDTATQAGNSSAG